MDLALTDRGSGPPLLLLHAFPFDRTMFEPLTRVLHDRFRVVALDLPGLGSSPVPADRPSMATVADRVLEALDLLGITRTAVLGISTGGYAALELVRTSPDRVSAVALSSTTTRLIAPDEPSARRETAAELDRQRSVEPVRESVDQGLGPTARTTRPELAPALHRVLDRTSPAGVAWMARAIAARADTSDALAAYAGPVLLLSGAEDEATPPARAEEMAALRDAGATRLELLPRTGHLTVLERPEVVAGHLAHHVGAAAP